LTVNGTVTLGDAAGSTYGFLSFNGTQTFGGDATVVFGGHPYNTLMASAASMTLTIGPGVTVRGQSGYIGYSPYLGGYVSAAIINQGTIQADISGGTINVNTPASVLTNDGTLNASSGTLTVSGGSSGVINNGTLAAGPTGTLAITGPYTQSATGNFNEVLGGSTTGLYGQTSISGTAALNGNLNISEANGFSPNTGNIFTFLSYTSETGQFANYTGLLLSGSAALQPAYNLTNATLTTVTDTEIAPDLRVTNLSINPANPQSSQSVTVNWNDLNAGNGSTGGSWTDQVLVTDTTTGQTIATGYVPYDAATMGALAPNGSAAVSYTFSLPDGPTGVGTLLVSVTTDYYDTILEYYPGGVGYTNNTTTITAVSTLAAYPDLQVSGLTVATANPQSGQPMTVDWNDANTGAAPVSGSFSDYLTVVNTTTGQTVASAVIPYDESSSGPIAAGGSAAQQYTFNLPDGPPGVGQLVETVTTDYYNQIYEYNSSGTAETNNTSSVTTTSTIAPYPDLQVTGLSTTPSSPESGQVLTVTWNDANSGDAPVSGSFSDYVTVLNTTTGQTLASALVPYDEASSGAIAAGGSAAQQCTFSLPDGTPGVGQIQFTVTTNYYNQVYEYNDSGTAETNNTSSITETSTIAPYPDLLVSAISLSPASGLLSGGDLTIDWTDSNAGDASTPGPWVDQVVVVNTTTGQTLLDQNANYDPSAPGNGAIAPNDSRDRSTSFTLPQGAAGAGDLQVTVTTNASDSFFEWNSSGTGQSNNTATAEITSALAPYPDLQVTGLTVSPAVPVSGGKVVINWNDANTGNGAVLSSFYDHVTVTNTTSGQVVAGGDVYYDASAAGSGPIAAGSSAANSFNFTLPNGAPGIGNLSVTVTTDYYNQVFEYNASGTAESNNSATVTATSVAAAYPDLQVQGLAVSPAAITSGSTIQVTWNDANTGNAPVDSAFVDNLTIVNITTGATLLSTDTGFDPTLPGNSPIDPGSSQPQAYSFTLPQGYPGVGNLTVTVTTDANNQVFEYNASGTGETNNTATVAATSLLAPYPDLAVSNVTAAASAAPGQQLTLGWTLSNSGNADASGPWAEQVLLVSDPAGDNPILLAAQTDSDGLAAGQSVSRSAVIQVPSLPAGNYWFEVIENPLGQVFEVNTANNTSVAAQPTSLAGTVTLTLSAHTVSNAAGSNATTATVTRNTDTTSSLDVTITNSDPNDVTVPQTVTIPAGATSVTFTVGTINNNIVEGTQTATLTASATGEVSGSDTLTVTDVNVPTLSVALNSHTVNETDPNPATFGMVTRNTPTTGALTVSLLSNELTKLTVPATVTIPAGAASATFPVTVINDQQIDGNVTTTITASTTGFVTGSDSAVVVDDNIPALALTLAVQTVSEAAGAGATTGTVSIASPASSAITITLTSSDTSAATVPATVVISAGQLSASFPIAAVDDGLDTGDKTAVISANVETNTGVIVNQGSTSASLLLKEADGPALTLSLSPSTVSKGTTGTATITRNTDTTNALVVTLASSDPTKATVPPTLTIPAGQASVSFSISAIDDHTPDGLQHVQITASATGLDTGIASLGITDVDLPDLVVSSVSAPASGYDNAPLAISWTVTNTGQYPASGSWLDRVYLDPVGGPQSTTPADTVPFNGTVNAGQSYTQTDTLTFPSTVGQYTVRVVTDANQFVQELSFFNNTGTSAQPLDDQAAYQVTLAASATTVSNGTPIVFSGVATMTSNGAPAASVPVAVQVMVAGTTRTLTATTDSSGNYSVTFQPLPNEAGQYLITAADPGVTNPPVKLPLEIIGMSASPASANVTVVPNTPLTGQFTLTNLGNETLTGITATSTGGPAGLNVHLTIPSQLTGDGTATLAYSLDETSTQAASGVVTIDVTTAQGSVTKIELGVSVVPLAPILATNPGYLNSGMVVGAQSLVSFTVSNTGGSPTGALQINLPNTSYMTLASPATIPSLGPGASSTVTLELSPAADLQLAQYTGTIAINGTQGGISVPFTFTAISSAVGTVHVLVDDDYTFQQTGSPHVQGATVNLLNPYDNTQIIATGVTDGTGAVTLGNVPAGPYVLQVQASGHSSYQSSYTVVPGITNNDEVFIARQFVTYQWTVVQTTIQDQYQIKLDTQFATDVPAPVVTISAPSSIPTLAPGQSGTFNVTITNHGLIAAQGVTLTLPTDVEYTFTAISNYVGEVPAQSSVVVPVTVTRLAPMPVSTPYGNAVLTTKVEAPNPIGPQTSSTLYVDYANTGSAPMPAPLLVLTATQNGNSGAFLSLNPALANLGYTSNSTPAGFNQTVQFLASGANPGFLEPGESVQIPIYYGGWLTSQWSVASPVTFSLTSLDTSNSQAINWSAIEPGLRPGSISTTAWNVIAPIMANNMGPTWGQYVQQLDNDAAYLAGIGEPTTDLSKLLSFEAEKANAAFTAQTLTSVTAESLPAPGMALTFVQSFQQSISGRYTSGILGYGWTTNWDIAASTMTNGDVAVNREGVSEYFSLQPNGKFAPEAGDQGTTLLRNSSGYLLVEYDGTFYQFSANGALSYVQDPNGNRITASYNAQGQLTSLTHSDGEYIDLTYNAQGHLSSLTDSTGQTETYGYDPTGQYLTSYTNVYGTINYTYITGSAPALNNALAEIAYPNDTRMYFSYDAQGRLIDQHQNGNANDQSISYLDPGGYVVSDANGNRTTVYFDLFGAAAETIDPLGNITHNYYDSNLNLTKVVGPGGVTYTYSYDARGNVISVTDPLGLTTNHTYDAHGNLTSYTDAKGNTTAYKYDTANDLLSITYANGTTQSYSYNPLGEATQYLNARGQAVGYTYNAQGLVATESFADGTSYTYTYNPLGNLTSATDAQSNTTSFIYGNPANPNLLTEVDYPDGTWLKFSYNNIGQRTHSVDQTGFTVDYSYDALGRLSELTDGSGNRIVLYTYDNAGSLIQKDMGNGTRTVYTYDADGNVLSITNYASVGGPVNSFDVYTYDVLGNVLTDTNQDGEWVYSYDADSQLTGAVFTANSTDPDGLTAQNIQYVYDAAGNRVSETVNGVTTTYVANNVNEYTSSTTAGVTRSYQYDLDGNLIAQTVGASTTTYSFNVLDQLTSVNGPGLAASYGYDALGNRVSQVINGVTTNFQIDPAGLGNVVATYDATGAVTAHYTYGVGLVSQVDPTGISAYYDFNNIGSTVGVTNTIGAYVDKYAYMPFGVTLASSGAVPNTFQYVGQFGVMTQVDGLDFMRARSYLATQGRFISPDPLGLGGQQTNLYEYAAQNPQKSIDPSGLCYDPATLNKLKQLEQAILAQAGQDYASARTALAAATKLAELALRAALKGNELLASSLAALSDLAFLNYTSFLGAAKAFASSASALEAYILEEEHSGPCPCKCPPTDPPTPPGDPGGSDPIGGSCTLPISETSFYECGDEDVPGEAYCPIDITGRYCTAPEAAGAISGFLGGGGGGASGTSGGSGGGGGGGGGGGSGGSGSSGPVTPTSGVGIIPPIIVTPCNCDPLLNLLGAGVGAAEGDASLPTLNLGPAVTGTNNDAGSLPTGGSDPDPLPFLTTALGNLGLIAGQAGNSGLPLEEIAQVVPTLAIFSTLQVDIAAIETTGANDSKVTGDMALLSKVGGYLQAITSAENALFGGDANWLTTKDTATLQQWITQFFADAQATSDGGESISSAERSQLLATTLPSGVSTSEASEFMDRWNRTVQYWFADIVTASQVPNGQSTDFLDARTLQSLFTAAQNAMLASQADGYTDPAAELRADLGVVANDINDDSVCATVKLEIDQTATLTRSAFTGTLTLNNQETSGPLTDIEMDLIVTDANGNPVSGAFYISSPTFSGGLNAVDGTGTLAAQSSGTVSYTFIPADSAAPTAPTLYHIGGTLKYVDPETGGEVTTPLFPTAITVYPQAQLQLNYFLQQNVIGDDPSTPQVEPSEPATLGLLVTNVGAGTADDLSITTAQPQIIQNQKGLAVNFQIIGTQVGNQSVSPSLTVGLGNVDPGQTADASFLLESSLQGVFEDFSATFTHSSALGGTETSLITSVKTHTLIHAGNFSFANSTGATDYLAEDTPNAQNLPDTIYFSDGTTAPVNIATNVSSSPVGPAAQLTFQVTADVTSGWDYIQIPDPGAGYTLYKVVRSDGTTISVSDQAWTTDRTISPTGKATVDYELHILDDNSTGSYQVYYRPTTVTPPAVASLSSVSSPQTGPVNSIDVTFSEPIDPTTFTTQNLELTLNGGSNLVNSSVTITQDSPTTFTIGGLSALTATDGNYTLTVSATGVSDLFGDAGTGSQSTSWATGIDIPVVVSVGAGTPSLRNTPVQTIDVVLSEPMDPPLFDYHALSLTLDGGPNLITSDVTVTQIDPTTYRIGGLVTLTTFDGEYTLTVSAASIVDSAGQSGVGSLSETWTMDTVGPTVASFPSYIQSPRNIVVPSVDVTFSDPIDPTTFTYQNITYSKAGGPNLITSGITIAQLAPTEFEITNFNNLIAPIDGTYTFTVSAVGVKDLAGNMGTGSGSETWVLMTLPPIVPIVLAISPNTGVSPGLTDTGSVTLTGTVSEPGLTVHVYNAGIDLGLATVNGTSFSIPLNLPAGSNALQVTAMDAAGNTSQPGTFTVFTDLTPLSLSSIASVAPNVRNTPVGSVDVTFSKPINPSTFTTGNLTLTDNGGGNLINGAVTISLVSGSTYQISGLSGLTTGEGEYTLTVDATGVHDLAGNAGTNSISTSWLMDTTPPTSSVSALHSQTTSTSFLVAAAGSDPGGSNGSTPSGIASYAIYVSTDSGPFTLFTTVPASNPSALFTGQAGNAYGFFSVATDNAGNLQATPASAQQTVQILVPLTVSSIAAVSPNPRSTPVSAIDVSFSLPVDPAAFSYYALTLTDNGGPNLITSAVTVTLISGTTYQIGGLAGLTSSEGSYMLTVDATGIEDQYGNPGTGTLTTSWLMDTTPPTSTVNPLPPTITSTSFTISVTGSDPTGSNGSTPSGIASFAVYVSADNGPFTIWTTVTPANPSALFTGQVGHSYGFYSVATDNAGNVEAVPTAAEATTQVVSSTIDTSTTVQSSEGPSKLGDPVTFTATVTPAQSTNGPPTGSVQFSIDSSAIGNPVPLDADGVATLTTSSLTVGIHTVTVRYLNTDGNFNPSNGTLTGGQTVTTADTTVAVGSSAPTSVFGQSVALTASVAAVTSGLPTPTGTVEFFDNTTELGTATLDGTGSASFSTSALAVGSHSVTVQYLGDNNFSFSTSSVLSQSVGQAGTTTTVTANSSPSVFGQTVTLTATITVVFPGSGAPSGTVEFFDGAGELGMAGLSDGLASLSMISLAVGDHSIIAQYLGNSSYVGSTSSAVTQTVNPAGTSTLLSANPSSSVHGQSVTFTASIGVVSPGTGTPTGTVAFKEGSSTLDTETLGSSRTVGFTTSALAVGSNSITAVYSGDPNFMTSSSSTTETVNQAGTTTNLSASPSSTRAGLPVTLTATIAVVAPGAGTPTGFVQFFVGATSLGTASLSGNTAILTTTALPVGTDSLTAQYLSDPNFTGSTSSAVVVTVNAGIATTTTLTSSTNPSIFGQSVTFTATVAPSTGSGTPTGTVTFYAGTTALGTTTLSSKKASLKSTSVPVGSQAITAVYTGDTTYAPSTSAVLTQTVNQDSTTTKVTSSANPSVYGQPVTLTTTVKAVSPGSGTPTGTVTFYDGTTNLGTGTLSGGTTTLSTTFFVVGSHSVTVVYSGDPDFTGSTSSALTQTVNQAGTTTAIVSSVDPSVYGQQLTFTATVSPNSPGSGAPTGTITFYSGSTQLGTGTLSGGTASLTVSPQLSVGNHTIKASYGGDTNFKTSAGTLTQTVNQDATTASVVSAANPSVYGQSVTFTATVVANAPGSGTPTGSVAFMNGTTTLGTVTLSGGTASYSTAKLATGLDTITATYNGSTSFITSSASLNQTVDQDATSGTVTSSLNPSVYGQSVTFTAIVSAASPGSGTPTGTVNFMDGSTTLNTATLNGSGKATFKTSALLAGSQSITVVYSGDTNFVTSTSPILSQTVNLDSTTTKLSSSNSSSVYGQSVTFTATVSANSPGSGTPTGTVAFMDGSTSLGTGTLSGGVATFSISTLTVGSHSITGVYSGDTNFTTSTSSTLTQTVKQSSTTTSVVSSANPSVAGQAVTFTATVSPVSPGSGTPTGTATFMDGSKTLGTATLSGGTASFTTSSLSIGTHSIKVVYSGDSDFKTSTSSVLSQVVQSSSDVTLAVAMNQIVDQVIGILTTDGVQSTASLVHDLAIEQVSALIRRPRRLVEF